MQKSEYEVGDYAGKYYRLCGDYAGSTIEQLHILHGL